MVMNSQYSKKAQNQEQPIKFTYNPVDKCQEEVNQHLYQILTEYNRRLFALNSYRAAALVLESGAGRDIKDIKDDTEFALLLARLNDEFHEAITKA